MQQTEHYQLNQWELDDRIQMEDFNHDNQNIEAALAAQAAELDAKASHMELEAAQKWVKIGEAMLSAASKTLTVTVPNVEQYHHLEMDFYTSGCYAVYPCWNGDTGPFRYAYYSKTDPAVVVGGHVNFYSICGHGVLIDWAGGGIDASGSKSTNDSPCISNTLPFSGTVTVGISETSTSGSLAAGSKVIVYGVKY